MGSAILSALTSLLLGCSGDTTGTGPAAIATTYFAVALNQHAINMSLTPPANTMQLTAATVNTAGVPVPDSGQTTFQSSDSSVTVSTTGLVTAHYVNSTSGTLVIALVRQGNLTLTDTAFVRVTATAPTPGIKTFSIQPINGDSAVRAVLMDYTPTVSATDSLDQPIAFNPGMTFGGGDFYWMRTSDYQKAAPTHFFGSSEYIALNDTGHVMLYATAWVYGVAVRDSLPFVIGWQYVVTNFDDETTCGWYRCDIFIGVGGQISWFTSTVNAIDIDFDDSTAVDSTTAPNLGISYYTGNGNVHFPPNPNGILTIISRRFPIAGTYPYHNGLAPAMTGIVYVLNNPK